MAASICQVGITPRFPPSERYLLIFLSLPGAWCPEEEENTDATSQPCLAGFLVDLQASRALQDVW